MLCSHLMKKLCRFNSLKLPRNQGLNRMTGQIDELDRDELVDLVKKLKTKNGQLSDQISQMKTLVTKMDQPDDAELVDEPIKKKMRKQRVKVFTKRKIALRFSYDGREFNGLQRSPVANNKVSIEDCLFAALIKCQMVDTIADSDYIAAGRTDKGVHAVNNVFSIVVNSQLTQPLIDAAETNGERDFISILNRQLPESIIVTAWAPVLFEFSARFNCTSRHYQYLFSGRGLDIGAMSDAAKGLIGEHDFRNFCQAQLERQDTKRICFAAGIEPVNDLPEMFVFSIRSSGFLYYQIRLTMSILALIGNGLEEVGLVGQLLDVEKQPRRPAYKFANPDGLILIDCNYEGLNWVHGQNFRFSANKVNSRLYSMKIAVAVQERIKEELIITDQEPEIAHKKITGISEKTGKHKKILDYDVSLNADDLRRKKETL